MRFSKGNIAPFLKLELFIHLNSINKTRVLIIRIQCISYLQCRIHLPYATTSPHILWRAIACPTAFHDEQQGRKCLQGFRFSSCRSSFQLVFLSHARNILYCHYAHVQRRLIGTQESSIHDGTGDGGKFPPLWNLPPSSAFIMELISVPGFIMEPVSVPGFIVELVSVPGSV